MGIDRIGKGGAPPVPETGAERAAIQKKGGVERSFSAELERTTQADAVDRASPLGQLRAGEIDVNTYVDRKVDEATRGLEGLSPAELADIKSVLKDQLVTDPGLADLVRTATGKAPTPPEE